MKPLRILGLETSSPRCGVAVLTLSRKPASVADALRTGQAVERASESAFARHSDILYGLLDETLRAARCSFRDLAGVAVSLGPGSFTGLRIGLAAAKVFARFGGLKLLGVPTFEAMVEEAALEDGAPAFVPTFDARRGEVFAAVYRRSGRGWRAVRSVRVMTPEALAPAIPPGARTVSEPPRAATVAAVGALRLLAGLGDDPDRLVPMYVRRPEAVERLLRARRRR